MIKAYVVGSFARDQQTTESDIDILCTFDESKGIHIMKIVQLTLELEEKLNRTVDIVDDFSLTNSVIRQSMMKDAIPPEDNCLERTTKSWTINMDSSIVQIRL